MRYKNKVSELISNAHTVMTLIKRGLENKSITPSEALEKITQTLDFLENANNLVEKEIEGMN